ncbi:MAG: acyl-CoA dehydrogenase family protein [Gammaproteobacteria bacterium]|nr:acyl-CoA dehydrogenase family protein [Gammaproteobacteria bacterium]
MDFEYTQEQRILADAVARFAQRDYGFEARRRILESESGCSDEVWRTFADMGLLGLSLPSAWGGFDGGAVDLFAVMETIGEALVIEPFVPTVGLGARLLARGASPDLCGRVLPAVVEGRCKLAFAHAERGARYDLAQVATRAQRNEDRWRLDGSKCVVLGAPLADYLLVSARTGSDTCAADGISVFLVDRDAPGLGIKPYRTVDAQRAADLELEGVMVDAGSIVGPTGGAHALIEEAVDFATALVCAEAVGAMRHANAATLEYLKTRRQFGVPIGSFQALQHRMVDMVISVEQSRSMACLACAQVDGAVDASARARAVSAAKVKIADACRHVSQEAVQLHGGMGMTEELKVSHTFRRLTMIAQQFGDADHHLDRLARLD